MQALSSIWIAVVLAVVAIGGGVASGASIDGTFADFCNGPIGGTTALKWACFHTTNGPPSLPRGVKKHSALIFSPHDPTCKYCIGTGACYTRKRVRRLPGLPFCAAASQDFALVVDGPYDSMFKTHTSLVLIYPGNKLNACVEYVDTPANNPGSKLGWCPGDPAITI